MNQPWYMRFYVWLGEPVKAPRFVVILGCIVLLTMWVWLANKMQPIEP